jgi:nucleoside-diphosphate-sugar epimerase
MAVTVFNRGRSRLRPLPREVAQLTGDITNSPRLSEVASRNFDIVVNFLCYSGQGALAAVETFRGRTGHYLHISTAMIYRKPPLEMPYHEGTERQNPFSGYARDKIAAEDVLMGAYATESFPVTIVRPSHTYDEVQPPVPGDWTAIDRIARGDEVVVPGDGTSLWTLTHSLDFAQGLLGLFGNPATLGEAFHITSDDVCTWDRIYELLASALGVPPRLAHVPSEFFALAAPEWGWSAGVLGDLRYSVLLDNSKIRRFVPNFAPKITFRDTVPELVRWRENHPVETAPNPVTDEVIGRLVTGYHLAEEAFASLAPKPEEPG